jgi:hypothetical protein
MEDPLDEGCGGKIVPLGDGWVRKVLKRKRSKNRNSAEIQCELQTWTAAHLTPENGYTYLFSPQTRPSPLPNSYEMRRIDTSKGWPWFLTDLPDLYRVELDRFSAAFEAGTGYRLYDIEFFRQEDGRVAIVDYDQCVKLA